MNDTLKSSLWRRLARLGLRLLLMVAFVGAAFFFTLAVYYSNLPTRWLRMLAAIVYALVLVVVLLRIRPLWLVRVICLACFGVVLAWFLLIPPSNGRDWQPDVAVLPYAEISDQNVTIHNIRNCDYRTESDYTVRHYDKTFDLAKLASV